MPDEQKVREETVSVTLSGLLEGLGIPNRSLLNIGGIPDIYVLFSGIRVIVETKEHGHRAELIHQLKERLQQNMCDLAVGLEYPSDLVSGAPTTDMVRTRLLSTSLVAICYAHGSTEARTVFDQTRTSVQLLPELLTRASSEVLPNKELDVAIHKIRETIEKFASDTKSIEGSKSVANKIREVLEFGEQ